jgi:hypothetical protein
MRGNPAVLGAEPAAPRGSDGDPVRREHVRVRGRRTSRRCAGTASTRTASRGRRASGRSGSRT